MALPADLDFSIKFDQTNDPANFELEDLVDYGTLGIATVDVRGNYTSVTDPLGNTLHNNTDYSSPDVLPVNSVLYTSLLIPTDVDDEILQGQYSFTYNIVVDKVINGVIQGAPSFRVLGNYAAEITTAGSITVVRSTGNNGTYTVLSAVDILGTTVITTVEAIPDATVDGAVQYSTQEIFSKTKTVTYSDLIPTVAIEVQTDCFCGNLKSIDKTNYGTATIVSRTHTVMYPAALQIADIVSSNATVTVSPIYTKTWTTVIESEISIDLGNSNIITAIITGSKETDVECDLTLCDISCCVIALNNRYLTARIDNPPLAAKYFADLTRMMQLIEMFQMAISCTQNDEAQSALDEIKKICNCQDTCVCDSDTPAIVVPLCSSSSTSCIKVIAGTGISISTSMANGCYNYQVNIASSIMSILNSVRPQNVVASTGISVVYSLVGGTDTWTITNTASFTEENRMEFLCRLQYTAPNACTITNSAYLYSGANINATATVASTTLPTAALNNNFRVSAFQVANNNNYKVTIQPVLVGLGVNNNSWVTTEIINKSSGQFEFRFILFSGVVVTNQFLSQIPDIYVNIKISE